MDLIVPTQFNFTGLSAINVLLGKNGSGKSTLLKAIESNLNNQQGFGDINYITPERGGFLTFQAGVEQNELSDPNWSRGSKRHNQWSQFKNFTVTQYRKLEMLALREIEKDQALRRDLTYTFDSIVEKINNLLTNIRIDRTTKGDFEIFTKVGNTKISSEAISSGESELIALAIECLTFEKICDPDKLNLLLLDEPDVHLHPDLQANLISFLIQLVSSNRFSILIATHSTAILGALLSYQNSRFAILANKSTEATFRSINARYQDILPIFGAHPLSNLFNQSPIFLVEGEDDERVFQKAIRTSQGALKIYPCSVDGIGNMPTYETSVVEIINGVYDNGKAYSLRDRDDGDENINDLPPIVRFKTSCRSIENMIVCDEVLTALGITWGELQARITTWLQAYPTHEKLPEMQSFQASGFNRKGFDLKEIRNVLVALTGSSKPWEIAIGETIGRLSIEQIAKDFSENKLCNYLGEKLSNFIRP